MRCPVRTRSVKIARSRHETAAAINCRVVSGSRGLWRRDVIGSAIKRAEPEPIYQGLLREMNDKQLESQATREIWLCEITLGGPWADDLRRRTCVKEECGARRGKAEIFSRAKQRVLRVLGKKEGRIND
jgi:hypothetical protein